MDGPGLDEEYVSFQVMADLICHLSLKKGQGRGAGRQPRERGPTHLQELRGTGPGLRVLIQGCL